MLGPGEFEGQGVGVGVGVEAGLGFVSNGDLGGSYDPDLRRKYPAS